MNNCMTYLQKTYCEVTATPETVLDHSLIVTLNGLWTFATWFIPITLLFTILGFLYGFLTSDEG